MKQFVYSFCHHQCDAGCGNGGDWVSGRGKPALAFRGISASVGFSAACRIFEGDTGQPQKIEDTAAVVPEESKRAIPGKYGIHVRHLLQLMLFLWASYVCSAGGYFDLPF